MSDKWQIKSSETEWKAIGVAGGVVGDEIAMKVQPGGEGLSLLTFEYDDKGSPMTAVQYQNIFFAHMEMSALLSTTSYQSADAKRHEWAGVSVATDAGDIFGQWQTIAENYFPPV